MEKEPDGLEVARGQFSILNSPFSISPEGTVLRQRAISSVFIVALTLGAAFLGRYVFAAFIAVAFGLIAHEFDALLRHAGHRPLSGFGYGVLGVLLGAVLLQRWERWAPALVAATV